MIKQEKIQYLYCTVSCTVSRDDRTIKVILFHQSAAQKMKKSVIVTYFTMKVVFTYVHITYKKKILFVKNILAYCWYSPTSPFFLLPAEHKHCDNAAPNWNSENARSRMVASSRGILGLGDK